MPPAKAGAVGLLAVGASQLSFSELISHNMVHNGMTAVASLVTDGRDQSLNLKRSLFLNAGRAEIELTESTSRPVIASGIRPACTTTIVIVSRANPRSLDMESTHEMTSGAADVGQVLVNG